MAFPTTFLDLQRAVAGKVRLDANPDLATGNDLQYTKDIINQVYAQIVVETELNQTSATGTLTATSATYTLPAVIARIKQVLVAPANQTGVYGDPLEETSLDEILYRRRTNGYVSGTGTTASMYAVAGISELELWPTPGSADGILIYYVALPTALSDATDVPILQEPYPKAIEYGALAEAADFLKDPDVDKYRGLYDLWMKKLNVHVKRRAGGHTRMIPVQGRTWWPHDPSVDTGL